MVGKDRLIFNTTDAQTLAASDKVGSYHYGADGVLITHTNVAAKEGLDIYVINPSLVVTATDLDIRNLDYTLDNVAVKGSTGNQLIVNADGSINVQADISIVSGSDKLEDAASASGDVGTYILGVRQDTLATSTSTDGDFGSLKLSTAGALYVNLAESTATITTSDAALAVTSIVTNATPLAVADTAEAIVASPLANRKYLKIYNNSPRMMWWGGVGVTNATGFPLSPGSTDELRIGAAVAIEYVASTIGAEMRHAQLA